MSSQLFPEVIDATTIGARFSQPLFLPVGIEGRAGAAGSATVGQKYTVTRDSQVDTLFGESTLGDLCKFLLKRGVSPVYAIASIKGVTDPTLVERQTAWSVFESDELIRIRLTDAVDQAALEGLAESAENADLIFNKQIAFGGLDVASDLATLVASAASILSKRFVLVGPGVYDENGDLINGAFSAAAIAAEVAKNSDIADDLDRYVIPGLTGIEQDSNGNPLFRRKVVGGVVENEFEDLLDGGVSPLMQPSSGGVAITHVRTTFTTDGTFDALMTRLIVDQIFIDVKDYLVNNNFLRRGNTDETRNDIRAGVQALLADRENWLLPKMQSDGTTGYNVGVIPSEDNRQIIVSYEGTVVRGIQTIAITAILEIPV